VRCLTSRLAFFASAIVLPACAHTREDVHTTTMTAEPALATIDREIDAVDEAPPVEPAPSARRPRLSQTITLGQGTDQPYTPSPPPPIPGAGPTQNVVVNNTVVVQGAPGYYGYGGYGRPSTFYSSDGRGAFRGTSGRGIPAWGSSGWEGARRTAAPGQTPGVGGNWSPPPSYGPAQMK
jgi:hypothetical protein